MQTILSLRDYNVTADDVCADVLQYPDQWDFCCKSHTTGAKNGRFRQIHKLPDGTNTAGRIEESKEVEVDVGEDPAMEAGFGGEGAAEPLAEEAPGQLNEGGESYLEILDRIGSRMPHGQVVDTGKSLVVFISKPRKAFVQHTQCLERKAVVKAVVKALVTPLPPYARASEAEIEAAADALYGALMRSDELKPRFKALARGSLGMHDPNDFKCSPAETWEAISMANVPESTIDAIGQYLYRLKRLNPFASKAKRKRLQLDHSYETVADSFWATRKSGDPTLVSFCIVKDPIVCIRDWTKQHHKRGALLWEHGTDTNHVYYKLLLDKGGAHVNFIISCINVREGDSLQEEVPHQT